MVLVSKSRDHQRRRSSEPEVSKWSHGSDSNRRPAVYETAALPAELPWRTGQYETASIKDSRRTPLTSNRCFFWFRRIVLESYVQHHVSLG